MLTNAEIEGWAHLSPRQRDCLEALRSGHCTDKQIARAVGLEVWTVMEYMARARHLLGAHHRVQLALIAERMRMRNRSQDSAEILEDATPIHVASAKHADRAAGHRHAAHA